MATTEYKQSVTEADLAEVLDTQIWDIKMVEWSNGTRVYEVDFKALKPNFNGTRPDDDEKLQLLAKGKRLLEEAGIFSKARLSRPVNKPDNRYNRGAWKPWPFFAIPADGPDALNRNVSSNTEIRQLRTDLSALTANMNALVQALAPALNTKLPKAQIEASKGDTDDTPKETTSSEPVNTDEEEPKYEDFDSEE